MKSSKSPRVGMPPRGRSSRSNDGHGSATRSEEEATGERRSGVDASSIAPTLVHHQVTSVLTRESSSGIEAMRRRMSAALARKQQMRTAAAATASSGSSDTTRQDDSSEPSASLQHTESSSDESVNTAALSTDSARTIRATFDMTPGAVRTPSYPFPRMALRLNRNTSHRSGPSHRPFTLLSPTNEPPLSSDPAQPPLPQRQASSSDLSTPIGQTPLSPGYPEDPNFPAPDLYDIILMLNAEPGLDMWWVNVTEVLSEVYGAERASLAVPGDITDLENVPWGQKATYNVNGSEGVPPSQFESLATSEADITSQGRRPEPPSRIPSELSSALPRRPPLLSRHSIAGPTPDPSARGTRQRPAGPVRAHSMLPKEPAEEVPTVSPLLPRLTRQAATPRSSSMAELDPLVPKGQYNSSGSGSSTLRCHVHRSIQPLEAETDPLLIRTGVATLFGKRKPIVLTRAYTETAPRQSPKVKGREDDQSAPPTPSRGGLDDRKLARPEDTLTLQSVFRAFDEYEQPEPADPSTRRSTARRVSEHKDDGERPLPELISSLMLNAVPLQLFLAKPNTGDLVWTNRKFDAFRSQGEGRVRDPWKNVHPADRNGLVKLWNEALRTGSQFTHYIRVKRFNSDSDFRWFVFRASTLLSNNGRLLYWIGSFLDVHEQYMKNLEASEKEAIMARDTKIRALADAIPQILFEAIEGDGIVAVNQQWHSYSGQTLEDARGLGFAKHVHRDDLHKCGILAPSDVAAIARSSATSPSSSSDSNKTVGATAPPLPAQKNLFSPDLSSLDRMIKSGSVVVEKDENGRLSYLTEIRLKSRGGGYRWFLVRLVRVDTGLWQSQSGKASWYGTCTDIETRKALERELNQANEKVHSEMESKTKFFANMSHEIRTPLNGILGSMPWLVESELDHDQRRTVDTIQNSANNLRELVDNILDVTKVEAGKMTLLPKWFHVRALCEEVVDTVSSRAIERGLELNYSLEANVPSMVKGDAFRVRQVLLNLLGNSVKFTEQGEVYMRCSYREAEPASSTAQADHSGLLSFDVVDTGRGFNEDDFKRLFKQFGQIGGGSSHEAGSGLGLFLSKQLVEMHGGELSVTSKAGEGSTFSFYIKVEVAPPGSEVTSPPIAARAGQQRVSPLLGGSPRSRSDNKTPTISSAKGLLHNEGIIQTPGLSRYVSSPPQQAPALPSPAVSSPTMVSPPVLLSDSSGMSMRSNSGNIASESSATSIVQTPESAPPPESAAPPSERQVLTEKAIASHPIFKRSKSDSEGSRLAPEKAHPQTYSVIIICPAEHARTAIKQHIEHVVPYSIAANVTTIPDIGSFLDLLNGPSPPTFTHIVLDIPATSDIMLFMRQMAKYTGPVIPALVVITDHYQKRDILDDFTALTASGRKAYMIHKPVKPSVFAMIFDPAQLRNLSKDRAREVAQSSSDDFRNIANLVKEKIGGKEHRVLLVEDSDVNRMVIQRYLKKVELINDCAKNGQQCVDMVQGQPPGYYSLIICDIQMPVKNGYEACTEIREWERSHGYRPSPIMALTAHAMPEERAAAANAGFTDYLTKPVDFNVLGTMMMTLLDPTVPHVFLRDRPLES
ncbi:Hi Kinase A phospho-acceptor domain-containing protein isoform 1 [Cladophialophora immunda]|nr:Hi Kinase A phospho-acceptor domain-containing protein isoform 1 [Cladophialophora immunda]